MKEPKLKPGMRFGRLVTVRQVEDKIYKNNDKVRIHECWLCRCDCGNETEVVEYNLLGGNSTSCGCLNKERCMEKLTKHGLSKTRINKIYRDMKYRCNQNNVGGYKSNKTYRDNNIKVCDEWLGEDGFINFYNFAMSHGYRDDLSIDRIDVYGNYCPENVRFVDMDTQYNNTTRNVYIEYNDDKFTASDWSKVIRNDPASIRLRVKKGFVGEQALFGSNKNTTLNAFYVVNPDTGRPIPQSQIDSGESNQFRIGIDFN